MGDKLNLEEIGGQHLYYLESCERQLWLYSRRITMENDDNYIEWGKLIHEEHFKRNKKEIRIAGFKVDLVIDDGLIHETKSSKVVKDQHRSQPLFYVYYLNEVLGYNFNGVKIHYPEIKQVVQIDWNTGTKNEIQEKIDKIKQVLDKSHPPPLHSNYQLCKKCSYFELCYI
ncbi:CRISPR-associated protein Cas4 [Natranaerobius trueperi]|uniref:CRISPR-associated protein Cas4 n=1 Tax=Natranaerobius trueperi TaxID=759412 RepID=UPI00130391AF|nr:CRISPR-associated protein Cas4 [Natranaerobius trueperi]